ncbi:MAG: cation:proton antiporter [Candidatus Woesearchaeota archaeon]
MSVSSEAIQLLSIFGVVMLVGILLTLLSRKLKITHVLLLTLAGVVIQKITVAYHVAFPFPHLLLICLGILALVFIVFDGASRLQIKEVDKFGVPAINVIVLFIIFNIFIITGLFTLLFFNTISGTILLGGVLFACMIAATDPGTLFAFGKPNNKAMELLDIEGIFNTPICVILPLIVLDIMVGVHQNYALAVVDQIMPFLKQIIVGVGAGVIIGVIIFKSMKKVYVEQISPVGLFVAALLAYTGAELLEGSGILAVGTFGILFGNMIVKNKEALQSFNSMLSGLFVILVFMVVGSLVPLQLDGLFLLKGLIVFLVLVFTRLFAFELFYYHKADFTHREKFFMALMMPKGIATAIVIFTLSVMTFTVEIQGVIDVVVQLSLLVVIYSLITATIVYKFAPWFMKKEEDLKRDIVSPVKKSGKRPQ